MRLNRSHLLTVILTLSLLLPAISAEGRGPRGRQRLAGPVKGQVKSKVIPWGRKPNPNHALRRQVGNEALLKATVTLISTGDLHLLPGHVRKALSKKARKPQRALLKAKTQNALLQILQRQVGNDTYETVVGRQAVGVKKAAQQLNERGWGPDDKGDMQRGWGWQLLPKNDKAFNDPKYLASILRETGQTGAGMTHNEPTRARHAFEDAWRKIAPQNTRPVAYALTGSDANNLLYSVALTAVRQRLGRDANRADILHFDGVYGGGRGPIAGVGFLPYGKEMAPNQDHLRITSPHSYQFQPKAKAEIKRLEKLETKALAQIEQKITTNKVPIGGLLIEPILGAKGVMFYRPEFLTKLRALCDKHKVPIMADEILTGGGRTGKFFGYQHYKGFEPDFVTFGKGLQVAGIAQVSRGRGAPSYRSPHGMTTLHAYSESLLKGARVINRIHDGNLMENARKVGAYMVRKLKKFDAKQDPKHTPEQDKHHARGPTRGMGLLMYSEKHVSGVRDAMGRLMPHMSITRKDVDQLITKKNVSRW